MRALSGDLSYSIGYDVEHDLFHAQNVFNDEYIKPTFIEYVQKLEIENAELKKQQFSLRNERNTFLVQNEQYEKDLIDFNENLTKAKELLSRLKSDFKNFAFEVGVEPISETYFIVEKFLKEIEQ